ncbi:polymeric immunoglobulin receptor-like isoform X2 [Channa argus]|uniref:polymeric immunoglobulin receptor-like isoform X2 n=1 Tax=Channa argus TaxID=215402 RepID=UPI00352265A1
MKLVHTLICCFFLSLQDGNISIINAQITTYKRTEGGDITVKCFSSSSGKWKIFCKEPCEQENILITTTSNRNQTGRYSIRYEEEGFLTFSTFFVSIKDLSTSDSGQYRCGLSETLSSASIMKFRLIVADALLDGDNDPKGNIVYTRPGRNLTVACPCTFSGSRKLFCKDDCGKEENILVETYGDSATSGRYEIEYTGGLFQREFLYVSITQLDESDSGSYRCCLDRTLVPDSYWDFRINVTDDFLLVGVLTLVVLVVVPSLVVLIICIKRKSRRSSEETDLRTRGNLSNGTNTEFPVYENTTPVPTNEESTYQTLDPASRDHNQIYSTLA